MVRFQELLLQYAERKVFKCIFEVFSIVNFVGLLRGFGFFFFGVVLLCFNRGLLNCKAFTAVGHVLRGNGFFWFVIVT